MESILKTKLYTPTLRANFVSRARLVEQLNNGVEKQLTLVSAPAGFGKTTIIREWLDTLDKKYQVAWLSLGENDNALTRFLSYLIASLQENIADMGNEVLEKLQQPQLPEVEMLLISLVNDILNARQKIVFILDDYHLIEEHQIHQAVDFLLENTLQNFHLVIITREDPPLPLARLRVRNQLNELRAWDLRFTNIEAVEFLNQVMGLSLSAEQVSALEKRTEGWIAGLQLAAISMQGLDDVMTFIETFTGSHRLVLDYLIEEVLENQPDDIQDFLLKTSILDKLNDSLCDTLTGRNDSQQQLERLEHANLFVIPLDDVRKWYRYHQLFADLLRQKLNQIYPEEIFRLHLRASEWYAQNNSWIDAVRHAFSSKNFDYAADLIELAWAPMNTSYQSVIWLSWAKSLPNELIRSRPALSTACGWALLDTGDLDAAALRFQDAEKWLGTPLNLNEPLEILSNKKFVLNKEEIRSLLTSIANGRAYLAQALGDVDNTVKYAKQATSFLSEDDYFNRGLSDILAGFAYWTNGELQNAQRAVTDAISNMQMTGRIPFIISFTSYLADIMIAQGRLQETKRIYLQLLEAVKKTGDPEVKETAVVHLALCEIFLEQGDDEAARQHLRMAEEYGKQRSFPPWYRHWVCAHLRSMASQGNWDAVTEMLKGAERLYYRHPIPDVRPLAALQTRAWLAQGELSQAQDWVHKRCISVDDELSYLHEFEHITLVRFLMAQYQKSLDEKFILDAIKLLERILKAAEAGQRLSSVIEISVLMALAYSTQNKISQALTHLAHALELAQPEGFLRVFVSEGDQMAQLLQETLSNGADPGYVNRLLDAFPAKETVEISHQTQRCDSELVEPLSEREIEILQLIANGLTNQKIGSKLYLSLNTVKAHTRNIYGKLGVNSRTQAVAKARDLGVL